MPPANTQIVNDDNIGVYVCQLLFTGNAAPASADIGKGQMALWLDPTNGAGKLMVKAKTSDGTVVTASVNLT